MLQVAVAAVMVFVSLIFTGCNDTQNLDEGLYQSRSAIDLNQPGARWECTRIECHPVDTGFWHTDVSGLYVSLAGNTQKYFAEAKSTCVAVANKDTADIVDGFVVMETSHTHTKTYVDGVERDVWKYYFNDSREVTITWSAEHPQSVQYEWTDEMGAKQVEIYKHGYDSIVAMKFVDATHVALTRGTAAAKYVKRLDLYTYRFAATTAPTKGNGEVGELHTDFISVKGISRVWDENEATPSYGDKIGNSPIDDVTEKDSVEIILTWNDGHKESLMFRNYRGRDIKNIARRQETISAMDNMLADMSFSTSFGEETLVRSDANWMVYKRTGQFTKNCSVHGTVKEVVYSEYRERSSFSYKGLPSKDFPYNEWNLVNVSDNFTPVSPSDLSGHDETDYTNEIGTSYLGWSKSLNEVISWYVKSKEVTKREIINKSVTVDNEYIHFRGEKIIRYSDGTSQEAGKISLDVLWKALPESNWTINTDHLGSYISNDLTMNQTSETSKSQGYFTYSQINKRFKNFVAGKENSGVVAIVKGCKYDDGEFSCSFDDVEMSVNKGNEGITKSGSEAGVDVYSYGCEAIVKYGDGVQRVTLPGTINVDGRHHEHGKVNEVLFTTTENENRSSYLSVCVIVFEDGYRSIGMAGNGDTDFSFTMSSRKDVVNSAVFNGSWIPANAQDLPGEGCMVWFDESGKDIRSYSYVKGNRNGWNNGNNTVIDPRRKGEISSDGYTVTFYLNGQKGKTLVF